MLKPVTNHCTQYTFMIQFHFLHFYNFSMYSASVYIPLYNGCLLSLLRCLYTYSQCRSTFTSSTFAMIVYLDAEKANAHTFIQKMAMITQCLCTCCCRYTRYNWVGGARQSKAPHWPLYCNTLPHTNKYLSENSITAQRKEYLSDHGCEMEVYEGYCCNGTDRETLKRIAAFHDQQVTSSSSRLQACFLKVRRKG